MPGPTWPNRLFAHAASSSGLENSMNSLDPAEAVVRSDFSERTEADCAKAKQGVPGLEVEDLEDQDLHNQDLQNQDLQNHDLQNQGLANQDLANQDLASQDLDSTPRALSVMSCDATENREACIGLFRTMSVAIVRLLFRYPPS
jgi:uncharacterized protein YjbI with pentapeptide repeats